MRGTGYRHCDHCKESYARHRMFRCVLCGYVVCPSCEADGQSQHFTTALRSGRERCPACNLLYLAVPEQNRLAFLSHSGTADDYRTRVRHAMRETGLLDEHGQKTEMAKGILLAAKLAKIGGPS